jgi:hypothetical protein
VFQKCSEVGEIELRLQSTTDLFPSSNFTIHHLEHLSQPPWPRSRREEIPEREFDRVAVLFSSVRELKRLRTASRSAKNYITRTQALKKLQVSLSDFRRLCILKGGWNRFP